MACTPVTPEQAGNQWNAWDEGAPLPVIVCLIRPCYLIRNSETYGLAPPHPKAAPKDSEKVHVVQIDKGKFAKRIAADK